MSEAVAEAPVTQTDPPPATESAPQTPVGLSKSQATKILKGDLANMVKKVASGRTLSSTERALLQGMADGDGTASVEWAANQVELANALNVERKTIQRWLEEDGNPGSKSDGRFSVSEWKQWAKTHGKRIGSELSQAQLRARQVLLQNEKLEYQIGILKGRFVPVVDVTKWGAELGAEVAKRLNMLPTMAPSLVGLSVPDCEARLKEIVDEALGALHLLDDRISEAVEKAEMESLTVDE